jgi:hypothetical protein
VLFRSKCIFILSNVDITEIRGLAETCSIHRPVFRTEPPDQNAGFRFPGAFQHAVFIGLETHRNTDAILRLVLTRGETRTFLVVPSRLHPFSHTEALFLHIVGRLIENHPSSLNRIHFLTYPNAFLLTSELMIVVLG